MVDDSAGVWNGCLTMLQQPGTAVTLVTIVSTLLVCVSLAVASCFRSWVIGAITLLVVSASMVCGFQIGAKWQRTDTDKKFILIPKP